MSDVVKDFGHMAVTFTYTNWKGDVSVRRVIPTHIYYGHTAYHTEDQWLMPAYDLEKKEWRTFAVKDISDWKSVPLQHPA